MGLRAFPVLYAKDVEALAAFYRALGSEERSRMPAADGSPGFIGLRRDDAELAVTTEDSPRMLAGVEPGPGPRHELFVYVDDLWPTNAPSSGKRIAARVLSLEPRRWRALKELLRRARGGSNLVRQRDSVWKRLRCEFSSSALTA